MGAIERDGLYLRHRDGDGSRPVLFVHGAMDRSSAFLRVARDLVARPWYAYDRRGYGRSPMRSEPATFDDHVVDLLGVVEAIRSWTGSDPVVVGHSIGGALALVATASRRARIAALLVHEPPLLWESWWSGSGPARRSVLDVDPSEAGEHFMRQRVGDEVWDSLPAGTRAARMAEGPTLQTELATARSIAAPDLRSILLPVVVSHGEPCDDRRRRAVASLREQLPDAVVATIAGAPHNAHLSHPAVFAALIGRTIDLADASRRVRGAEGAVASEP